ncbi:MAG: PLDc N-terminal domain-containing protein [Verrucomicrobia bacterium]|nr:PLDc N-terminal domain-containing protein [Verrucomicrobiota bacterium]
MLADLKEWLSDFIARGLITDLTALCGFLLALLVVARLMSQKKAPANTFAWLLVIVLVPYVGVPLYLLLGGRKLRRLAARKLPLTPALPGQPELPSFYTHWPVAQTIMAAGGTSPVAGNRLRLLTTGQATYAEIMQQIRAARHCIHLTTFILGRDDTGRAIVQALAERAREGVKVRLLLDSVGSMFIGGNFLAPLRAAGGEVIRFMPVLPFTSRGSANLRNHRKIAVFDHTTAIIGGHNLAIEYMGPSPYRKRFADLGAVIEGPAAAMLHEVFIADWCFASRRPPATLRQEFPAAGLTARGTAELQVVASGPDVPGDPLYEGIVSMIQEAEVSIWLVTPYFIPDEVLLRSLIVKARAGREVTLVLPARSNHPVTDFARRHYVRELRRAGGRVMLYGAGMLHSKALIVDDRIALLGSANFDLRSLFVNFEIGLVVHSDAEVGAIKAWASELLGQCHELKTDPNRRQRLPARIVEDFSRLLAPLL